MSKGLDIAKLVEASARLYVSVDSGTLLSSSSAVLGLSCGDPYQSKSREFFKQYNSSFALATGSGSFSRSKALRLVVQEGEKPEELFWEVWNSTRLIQVKDLKKIHTKLAGHSCFGRAAWSTDDKYVLYIAEPTSKKSSSFWSGEENVGSANIYKETFGEGLKHLTNPTLFLYDIPENSVKEVSTFDSIYPAQPFFRPGTDQYVFIGYEKTPYKLGISAMLNRKSKLYKKSISSDETEEIIIPNSLMAALFPKFSPNGRYLSYYGVPKDSLCHCMCVSLHVYDMDTQETKTIIEVVNNYNENFNGIYGFHDALAPYNWLDNERIVFSTAHDASELIFMTDLSGNVTSIDIPLEKPYGSSILDIYDSTVLLKASSITTPDQVFKAHFSNPSWSLSLLENTAQEPQTDEERLLKSALSECKVAFINHSSSPIKSILYYTPGNKNLIVAIHGGPHAAGMVSYNLPSPMRLAVGFNMLVVNYRGSIGFGESIVKELLGNVGTMDVADCIEAINLAREVAPAEKVVVSGGSHGGFLSLHLSCVMDLAGSVVANGALNIASMSLCTDITDWCFAEVLVDHPDYPATDEQYVQMYRASPLWRLGDARCPILLIAGGSDLRVPPAATMEAYRVLRANGRETKLLWYSDEGHGLLGKAAGYDVLANSFKWILEIADRKQIN